MTLAITQLGMRQLGGDVIVLSGKETQLGRGESVEDTVEFLRTGSMGRMMLAGADAGTVECAVASVRAALAPHADAEGVHLGAAVWLVQAMAP